MDSINGAVISPDGKYRTRLWRIWDPEEERRMLMIGLNPSTAAPDTDDPTIRRMVSFARREGCGGLEVVNLYSWRATDPKDLWAAVRAGLYTGYLENMRTLRAVIGIVTGPIVCAWGAQARAEATVRLLAGTKELYHLGLNKNGTPKHPLYVKDDTPLTRWRENTTCYTP